MALNDSGDRELFVATERWGSELYGDPCMGCGFKWLISPLEAAAEVSSMPMQYRSILNGTSGNERHQDLTWGPVAYVCHVGDNLVAWAGGLAAGLESEAKVLVPGYDPDLLAKARRYDRIPLEAAIWALDRAAAGWCDVVLRAVDADVVISHAARGEQRAADIARNNTHDAYHHLWDIGRIVGSAGQ